MTEYEFQHEVSKLKGCFPSGFSNEKIRIIFEKTNHISASDFTRIVDRLILSSKNAPSVAEIVEMANIMKPRVYTALQLVHSSCSKCDNGIIMAFRIGANESFYSFLCDCRAGDQRLERYPKWNFNFEGVFKYHG